MLFTILFTILLTIGISAFVILLIGMFFVGIFHIVLFIDSFDIQDLFNGLLSLGGSLLVLSGLAYAVCDI